MAHNASPRDNEYSDVDVSYEHADTTHGEDDHAPKSLFTLANLKVAQVNILAGTLNGYSIGFVGVYSTLYGFSSNCGLYSAETSCEKVPNTKCVWEASSSDCRWTTSCKALHADEFSCNSDSRCNWSYTDSVCQNPSGFSSLENGIFAGAMIIGCMIGSFFAGPFARKVGPSIAFITIGLVSVVCSVIYHVSTAVDQFWLLCAARLVIGVALGLVGVAAPMFTAEHAHPKYSKMIGVMFQLFTTFGIFIAATIGLAVGQTVKFDADSNQNIRARMQALCVFSTFLSLLVVVLGILLRANKKQKSDAAQASGEEPSAEQKEYGWCQMLPRLLMGIVMAGTLQLTGINAVMNYAPTIMGSLGLAPLVGNFIVMVWNFVTTIAAIPLASVFTMRQLFLAGSIFTSCMCMFMCGIPVYPGVTKKEQAKNGVAITGILIFIAFFEICVGPCYYVLTQDMFPPSFRPKGASFTQVIQFSFNVIINVCYPIATEDISGGPSGNQDKGQAIAFIFFGGLGIICFIIQVFFLHPWEGDQEESVASVEQQVNSSDMDLADKEEEEPVSGEQAELGIVPFSPRSSDNREDVL